MKKTIAIMLALGAFTVARAQEQQPVPQNQTVTPNKPSPEQMATRHSMHLQKMLGLSDDQKQKTYQAVLARNTAIQSIRAKYGPNGDRKAMHAEAKPVKEQFVQTMNGILTPEQKIKWEEERLKLKENRLKNKQVTPSGGNGSPQKLTGEDDGIND